MLSYKCVPGSPCRLKWSPETISVFGAYWKNASAWWVLRCFSTHLRSLFYTQTAFLRDHSQTLSLSVLSHKLCPSEGNKNSLNVHQNMSKVTFFLFLQLWACNWCRNVLFNYESGIRIWMFWVYSLAGIVQNSDAGCIQWAVELSPENLGVHGTHSPHPQGLQLVWLNRSYAGITILPFSHVKS